MILVTLGFFSLAALVGVYLLTLVLRRRETPKGVAIIHGVMAATGIVLLLVYLFGPRPDPIASVVLFTMAAIAGAYLAIRDVAGRRVPRWLAVGHGLTAVTGYVFLLVHAIRVWTA